MNTAPRAHGSHLDVHDPALPGVDPNGAGQTTENISSTDSRASVCPEYASSRFLERIPRDFARGHLIFSQGERDGRELLVVAEDSSSAAIFNTGVRLARPVSTIYVGGEAIARAIDQAYGAVRSVQSEQEPVDEDRVDSQAIDRLLAEVDRDLLSTGGKAPVVKLVDAILFDALGRGASDVHVQPLAEESLVRYRLDGVLHTVRELSRQVTPAVTSRIKVMGRMDIAERRIPQDGRASVHIGKVSSESGTPTSGGGGISGGIGGGIGGGISGGRAIDLRISTLPTSYGERAVIRLLDNTQQLCDFGELGMPADVAASYLTRANRSSGIILVTGPTGSGKTTTLYSTLRQIGSAAVNIMTIEDPIEYELSGMGLAISQAQVNLRKGVTFATGLRHILRQDPDVIMVGEIRDAETARIAIQSSLTGHVVFSTLHTNDAAGAMTRLIDLGVEPYLVSASLSAVLAQRLVRLVHPTCAGAGCEACLETGLRGRTGIFELITVNEQIKHLISTHAPVMEIRQAARSLGTRTLREEADRLVSDGKTTRLEADRVVEAAI